MPQLRHRPRDLIQNRYEVRKLLGSGAFGTVYGCRDTELDVPVAVKELHVLEGREAALAQFRSEAIHLSRLRHPHIVSGHYEPHSGQWRICPVCGLDFPQLSHCPDHNAALLPITSRHYLVMEYIAGPDLMALCESRGGMLDCDETLDWARQIASALALVHQRGFVHRDIKPENIRLREDDSQNQSEAVLLDFGIATPAEAVTGDLYGTRALRQTQGGGTIGYAPESPEERRAPDARSDIYAFGMTLYHLLCGLDPTQPGQLARLQSHTPRDFVPPLPLWVDELICDCIAYDPQQRPQNGTELLQRLDGEEEENEPDTAPTPFAFTPGNQTSSGTTILSPQTSPTPSPVPTPNPATPAVNPLVFRSGHYARNISDLVWMCEEYPEEGAKRLYAGEFEKWLDSMGETEMARQARSIRSQYRSPQAGLETFLQATGLVVKPNIVVNHQQLDFGSLRGEKQVKRDIRVQNSGRGWLFGQVRNSGGPVTLQGAFEGNKASIPIQFDAFRLSPGRYEGQIEIDSSAGKLNVPWMARVLGPSWWPPFLVVAFNGLYGAALGGGLRAYPFSSAHLSPSQWLNAGFQFHNPASVSLPFAEVFALGFGLWTLLLALYRRSCVTWIFFSFFGILATIVSYFAACQWLIAGDIWLKPSLVGWFSHFPPGAWMLCGGWFGATLGALLRWRDLASERIGAVALGFIVVLGAVYLASSGAIQ